jgi:hypothetical protein
MQGPSKSLEFKAEDVIARKKLAYFFDEQMEESPLIYLDSETDNLFEHDDLLKRKVWRA